MNNLIVALKRKFPNARHIEPEYLGNGLYRMPSHSEPGKHYLVDVSGVFDYPLRPPRCGTWVTDEGERSLVNGCKGFEVRQWCRHVEDAAMEHLRMLFRPKPKSAEVSPDAPDAPRHTWD